MRRHVRIFALVNDGFIPNHQHLAIFATIVRADSISKAAVQLGYGKSVVSRQLARLESEVKGRLRVTCSMPALKTATFVAFLQERLFVEN